MRKKLFFVFLSIFSLLAAQEGKKDSILIQINNQSITKAEFEYLYHKNNYDTAFDKKTLEEYLDMFINFKLKVEDAKAEGLDSTRDFLNEFHSYRDELIKPYLVDQEAVDFVLKEAYDRMNEDIELSHILVSLSPDASPKDSLEAWKKMKSIKKKTKRQDFGKLAQKYSDDRSGQANNGYMGWITAFSTIYPFENQAYNTPVSKTSAVFRTRFGYHILKVHNRRKSLGERLVSHIMCFTNEGDEEKNKNAKNKIDSIYQSVLIGNDFGTLAKDYSEDRSSAVRNGELPWLKSGSTIESFEKAAFSIKNIGETTKPIQTVYGWHIIKLLDQKGLASYDKLKPEIEKSIQSDARAFRGKDAFLEKLKKKYKPTIDEKSFRDLSAFLQTTKNSDDSTKFNLQTKTNTLFTFADKRFSQADFLNYLYDNAYLLNDQALDLKELRKELDDFINESLYDYEENRIVSQSDSVRFLLQEYHDGILLFELSNRKVWEKAATDTVGLEKFFQANKADYVWDKPHYKGYVVQTKDKETQKLAQRLMKSLPADSIFRELPKQLNDSVIRVKVEYGLFAQGENRLVDKEIFKSKDKLAVNEQFPYFFLVGKNLKFRPESYTDVFSLLLSDYQFELERLWVNELRSKYKVEINEELLKTIKEY